MRQRTAPAISTTPIALLSTERLLKTARKPSSSSSLAKFAAILRASGAYSPVAELTEGTLAMKPNTAQPKAPESKPGSKPTAKDDLKSLPLAEVEKKL